MTFSDKLISLRRQKGWSQEELADRMYVTRQSVSKWESGQALPEIDKILKLSELFGVSTDYLLKDYYSDTLQTGTDTPQTVSAPPRRRVTLPEAEAFLNIKAKISRLIALATFLCVISPACLLFLSIRCEQSDVITESVAGCFGILALLIFALPAVALYIYCGGKTSEFEYLEKELFDVDRAALELAEQRKQDFSDKYTRYNILGTCLCILSVFPLFIAAPFSETSFAAIAVAMPVLLFIAAFGVYFFIRGGIVWASLQKLLQEGDYSSDKKNARLTAGAFVPAYWLIVTAFYLLLSFLTELWAYTWLVWVVAGIIFPVYVSIVNAIKKRR